MNELETIATFPNIDTSRLHGIADEATERASAIVARADRENRKLTPDETAEAETLCATQAAALSEIESRQPVNRQAQPPHLPVPADAPSNRGAAPVAAAQDRRRGILIPSNCASPSALLLPRAADVWNGASDKFFLAIANGMADPRLLQNAIGTEGSGVDGGFAVPAQFFSGILDQALQQAEFAPRCRIFPTAASSLQIPMPDLQNRQTDIAGLSGNWAGENQSQTSQRLKWRSVDIRLHKIFILAEASGELASDGLNFASQLETQMSAAAAYSLDAAILGGSGVGQPLGILNDPSAIAVAPESGQAADTITFMNIIQMFSRLSPASQKNAVWFVSPSVMSQLLLMVFPSSGGTTIPVLLGSGNPTNAGASEMLGTILGRPCVVSEICKPLGDPGDIVLADLSQFALVMRNSARIEMDLSRGFDRDAISWRLIWRVSGQGMWNSPIVPYSGGQTLGWCSYLTARA